MLDYFFSVKHAGRGDLFEGLSIWEDKKYRQLQGTYPVIFLSFANIKGRNYQNVYENMCQLLADTYADFEFILDSSMLAEEDRRFFKRITAGMKESDAVLSVHQLSKYLFKYFGKKAIILLDEYDTPMQEAYLNGYWDEMADFTRRLFNAAFKTNPYLERGLMTGITRISKESIFSDLNNLEVVTTTSCIYNPWSIINFLDKRKFKPYWVNTSSNTLVSDLIRKGNRAVQMAMEGLLQGKPFETCMDEEIIFSCLGHSENAVWSLFVAGGYLKAADRRTCDHECGMDTYTLMITNLEVKKMLRRMILEWFSADGMNISSFTEALLAGDKEYMNQYLNEIMYATLSCYDTGREQSRSRVHENFYHGFVLGLVADLRERYVIASNRESGLGRYDVMLKPRNAADCGIILEFKVLDPDREKSMQETADAALRQIVEKGYAAGMEEEGISMEQIRIYGFAFSGKKVLIDGGCVLDYNVQTNQRIR